MTTKNTGGPAFTRDTMNHNPYTDPVECPECGRQYERTDWDGTTPCPSDDCPSHEASLAGITYRMADAMLKAREVE